MDNRKEWEELVAQANGSKVDGKFYNLDVSVIPIILWADARIRALEEAVEWALDNVSRMDHDEAFTFKAELRRRAGRE